MVSALVGRASGAGAGARLVACVTEHGSAAHPYLASTALLSGPDAARNLSDAVHHLCTLHGRHPGIVDHAAAASADPGARAWLAANSAGFATERGWLARLAVAAGPVPGTPGSADTEAVVLGQRHALEMLARSERAGCALGAAIAVILDWAGIRTVLNAAARRFGVEAPPSALPEAADALALVATVATDPAIERALLFGAEQIALQHFGLWDLLEARQLARSGQPA
jgi:hypothetical protein